MAVGRGVRSGAWGKVGDTESHLKMRGASCTEGGSRDQIYVGLVLFGNSLSNISNSFQ